MTDDIQKIYAKMTTIEAEISDLRHGYVVINKRYIAPLASLKELTLHASEAAKRSATGSTYALEAVKKASIAANEASDSRLVNVADSAADAAASAAESAIQAAAAAASAAAAAAAAVSHQAEESSLRASAEASEATKIATEAAAEAVKLANLASDTARSARIRNENK